MRINDKGCKRFPEVCGEVANHNDNNAKVCQLPNKHEGPHDWSECSMDVTSVEVTDGGHRLVSARQRIQFVKITLSDGRVGTFSGPEFVKDLDESLAISKIQFIESRPLPPDMHFGTLDEPSPPLPKGLEAAPPITNQKWRDRLLQDDGGPG